MPGCVGGRKRKRSKREVVARARKEVGPCCLEETASAASRQRLATPVRDVVTESVRSDLDAAAYQFP